MERSASNTLPVWFNEGYLEKILQSLRRDSSLKVRSILIRPASGKGDNIVGTLKRIFVEFITTEREGNIKDKKMSFICKLFPEGDDFFASIVNPYNAFEEEMDVYERVLPKISNLLIDIVHDEKLFANSIFLDHEHKALLLEDVSDLGFVMGDRYRGLDFEHAKLALKKLAMVHAATISLDERYPGIFQNFDRGLFNRYTRGLEGVFVEMVGACSEHLEAANNGMSQYAIKLQKLKPYVMEYAEQCFVPSKAFFNTLIHGDFWVSNIMFKYENGYKSAPRDAVLIDFQFCCWASPVIDLNYFFNNSLQEELWDKANRDDLTQYYYKVLTNTLRDLKFAGTLPSLKELYKEMEKKAFISLISGICTQPHMTNTCSEDADFKAFLDKDDHGLRYKRKLFNNPRVMKYLQKALPIFDQQGLLDVKH